MQINNFIVSRLVMHEVYKRGDDGLRRDPTYGQALLRLSQEALDTFQDRIVAALGRASQSMEMTVGRRGAESAVQIAADSLGNDDAAFAATSRRFADKLADEQTSRGLPGGVLLIFTGSVGHPARPIVGVVKAETHGGFRRTQAMQIEFFRDLFLTPNTKLYKLGVFRFDGDAAGKIETENWSAAIYDSLMTTSNPDGAANYFYESFLGLEIPQSSARLTRLFYQETRNFVNASNLEDGIKHDLLTGLYTYLAVDQSPVVDLAVFANQYMPDELRDEFQNVLQAEGFPPNAIQKDNSQIKNSLKQRRIRFSRNIQLVAPPDAFDDLISVETFTPEGEGGPDTSWTRITIKDHIRDNQ